MLQCTHVPNCASGALGELGVAAQFIRQVGGRAGDMARITIGRGCPRSADDHSSSRMHWPHRLCATRRRGNKTDVCRPYSFPNCPESTPSRKGGSQTWDTSQARLWRAMRRQPADCPRLPVRAPPFRHASAHLPSSRHRPPASAPAHPLVRSPARRTHAAGACPHALARPECPPPSARRLCAPPRCRRRQGAHRTHRRSPTHAPRPTIRRPAGRPKRTSVLPPLATCCVSHRRPPITTPAPSPSPLTHRMPARPLAAQHVPPASRATCYAHPPPCTARCPSRNRGRPPTARCSPCARPQPAHGAPPKPPEVAPATAQPLPRAHDHPRRAPPELNQGRCGGSGIPSWRAARARDRLRVWRRHNHHANLAGRHAAPAALGTEQRAALNPQSHGCA